MSDDWTRLYIPHVVTVYVTLRYVTEQFCTASHEEGSWLIREYILLISTRLSRGCAATVSLDTLFPTHIINNSTELVLVFDFIPRSISVIRSGGAKQIEWITFCADIFKEKSERT